MKKILLLLILAVSGVVFLLSPVSTLNKFLGFGICMFGIYYVAQLNSNLSGKGK